MLKIDILCDVEDSFMHEHLPNLLDRLKGLGIASLFTDQCQLSGGDVLLLISCGYRYPATLIERYNFPVVAHPSKLPKGRGSAAVAWDILSGSNELWVTLFRPTTELDRGPIYDQAFAPLSGFELMAEIRKLQAELTFKMIEALIRKIPNVQLIEQQGHSSFYRRRTREDSQLDTSKSIEEQFNLLRICDNDRYPAFFYYEGVRYFLKVYR